MAVLHDPSEYQGLVNSIARKVATAHRLRRHMEELQAFGQQGLMEAYHRFDADRGNAFSTFAYYRIKGAIIDGCRSMGLIRRRRRGSAKADQVFAEHQATRYEDRQTVGVGIGAIALDLDEMVSSAAVSFILSDSIDERTASKDEDPETRVQRAESDAWVREQVARLPPSERQIIEWSFFQNKTLDEIGAQLGCSKSWASRRRSAAMGKLKDILGRSPDDL